MRKLVFIAAFVVAAAAVSAQNFNYGIKGGLNLSDLSNVDDSKMKPSIYVGLYGEYFINDLFGIQPEITYSRQGAYFKGDDENGNQVKQWNRLNYANVAVMAKIYATERLSVDVGPQFGILLAAKNKFKQDGNSEKIDVKDNLKSTDFSIGMGISYKLTPWSDMSVRYNLGISDIAKNNGGDKVKNNVIQIGLGYEF